MGYHITLTLFITYKKKMGKRTPISCPYHRQFAIPITIKIFDQKRLPSSIPHETIREGLVATPHPVPSVIWCKEETAISDLVFFLLLVK